MKLVRTKMPGQSGICVPNRPPVIFAGHNTYLMNVTRVCREGGQFTDVVFHCSDGKVAAHKLVLAAASKFLRDVLVLASKFEMAIA